MSLHSDLIESQALLRFLILTIERWLMLNFIDACQCHYETDNFGSEAHIRILHFVLRAGSI